MSVAPAVSAPPTVPNLVGGKFKPSTSSRRLPVNYPTTGEVVAEVPLSTAAELDEVVAAAAKAQREWAKIPMKARVQVLFKFKSIAEHNIDRIAQLVSNENGKTLGEAKAEVEKGIECVEYATCLPQIAGGEILDVSRGVECRSVRYPVGVVAGITPFNFPSMVPMWMFPLALGLGNAFILKPSEQTPLAPIELAKLLHEAGLPPGVFSIINGDREIVEALCDHPGIGALGFVGSTKVAKLVYARGTSHHKRVRALGGAKNHLVVVPDADPEMTASNIVASFTGCAGQRCMAASVVVTVGDCSHIIKRVKELAADLVPGKNLGAVISSAAKERIEGYITRGQKAGLNVVLDGRNPKVSGKENGTYVGPTILVGAEAGAESACDEIFGPVLTIIEADTLDEALSIENSNRYGNAAAIYTTNGGVATYFAEHASAGMIGINIGVPVPREPFAFGGWNDSAFGDGDITGKQAIDFWSKTKKITTKWSDTHRANWMS
jgi:malonate-semialdehyde dehydrogenase (acetylating)/methylmalonate-semialdehyde dehydrogenase